MINPFKQEEKKPYTYSSIEMRKSSRSYIWWIIVVIAVIAFIGIYIGA